MRQSVSQSRHPLAPVQRDQLLGGRDTFAGNAIVQLVCRCDENLDLPAFEWACEQVLANHDVLRTRILLRDGREPEQAFPERVKLSVDLDDWRRLGDEDRERRLTERLLAERERGFDPGAPPLLRFFVSETAVDHSVAILSFHRAILDSRSLPFVLSDLFEAYDAYCSFGTPEVRYALPYRTYLAWLRRRDLESATSYWRLRLDGFEGPTPLPGEAEAGPEPGAGFGVRRRPLPESLDRDLGRLLEREQICIEALLQGAWAALLAENSGQEDVLFGVERDCRLSALPGEDRLIGPYTRLVPMRLRVPAGEDWVRWLRRLQGRFRALRQHEHAPREEMLGDSPPEQAPFESAVAFEGRPLDRQLRSLGRAWRRRHFELVDPPRVPVELRGFQEPGLVLELVHQRERLGDEGAEAALERLAELLEEFAAGGA